MYPAHIVFSILATRFPIASVYSHPKSYSSYDRVKMFATISSAWLSISLFAASCMSNTEQAPLAAPSTVPLATHEHWMGVAKQALSDLVSPCPSEAFGAAIVNHTSANGGLGELVCIGVNDIVASGNPTLHGEIAGINNCTAVLQDPSGPYKLSPAEMQTAFRDLTLYTTAEPCPMCASAILWAGFRECVFATSMQTLAKEGWSHIKISSHEVFSRSKVTGTTTNLVGGVLSAETDPLFQWHNSTRAGLVRMAVIGKLPESLAHLYE